jgi:hypothetical protein
MKFGDEFRAKRGKFKGLNDEPDTWRDLYKKGGEDLLREYAEHMLTEHDFFAKEADGGFLSRLTIVVSTVWLSEEQFWYYAFKRVLERNRFILAGNKYVSEEFIEAIWIGNYLNADGTPYPDAAACCAYFNNYKKALSIYVRRPDLRRIVTKEMRVQFEYSLRREGIIPVPDDSIDLSNDAGKLS